MLGCESEFSKIMNYMNCFHNKHYVGFLYDILLLTKNYNNKTYVGNLHNVFYESYELFS